MGIIYKIRVTAGKSWNATNILSWKQWIVSFSHKRKFNVIHRHEPTRGAFVSENQQQKKRDRIFPDPDLRIGIKKIWTSFFTTRAHGFRYSGLRPLAYICYDDYCYYYYRDTDFYFGATRTREKKSPSLFNCYGKMCEETKTQNCMDVCVFIMF